MNRSIVITSPSLRCPQQYPISLNLSTHTRRRCVHVGKPYGVGLSDTRHAARTTRTAAASDAGSSSAAGAGSGSERQSIDSLSGELEAQEKREQTVPVKLMALVSLVLLTGVSNRVLYKMALVPLRDHIFFLAQVQNLGYLAVYFTALAWRIRSGRVTPAMLAVDKRPLAAVGACEALAQLLFMVGAAHLPGPLLPVINQTYLVWSLVFASLILGARYSRAQLAGASMVLVGVIVAAIQPSALASLLPRGAAESTAAALSSSSSSSSSVELQYVAVCVACFAFPAIANCIKEKVFRSAASSLGRPLDIFVVNSFGSLAQAFFVLLMLPATTALKGISLPDLPAHLAASAKVFLGQAPAAGGAAGAGAVEALGGGLGGGVGVLLQRYAPLLLALSYVGMNLVFNISILTLLRSVGSVTTTLVGSSLVPLTIVAFTLPLPYLEPAILGPNFIVGASLLMGGLVTYNWDSWRALLAQAAGRGAHGGPAGREPPQGPQPPKDKEP